MPLIERYKDGSKHYSFYDIPDTLAYDQRIEVGTEEFGRRCAGGHLADAENNVRATCLITTLEADFGWTFEGIDEACVYAPSYNPVACTDMVTLDSHFERNLKPCVQADRQFIIDKLRLDDGPMSYVKDPKVRDAVNAMSWPGLEEDGEPETEFASKFNLMGQYVAGRTYASGYHLGGGYVGTAGHCLVEHQKQNKISSLKVVFGWFGDVRSKRFRPDQVFDIESVILCDDPGTYDAPTNEAAIASWTRRWDSAIIKLKGGPSRLDSLAKVNVANTPPTFGTPIYNIGHPLGTPMKISWRSHVLRHTLAIGDNSPFNHQIAAHANYSTDLDQFPGNSGGPVFDAETGYAVGHTVSTQNGVSESTPSCISKWEKRFIAGTKNYKLAHETINPHLARTAPGNPRLRIHPKFNRTLSGLPHGGDLFLNTTFVSAGDIGPNNIMLKRGEDHRAVFNRDHFESPDVVHRNLTGRLDQINIFMKSMADHNREFIGPMLLITLVGLSGVIREPEPGSKIIITIAQTSWEGIPWEIPLHGKPQTFCSGDKVVFQHMIDIRNLADRQAIPSEIFDLPVALASWSRFALIQPSENPPILVRLDYLVQKDPFPFSVNQNWPPNRPDITANARDQHLIWPGELFHFATTVGESTCPTQKDDPCPPSPVTWRSQEGDYVWKAPIDRVWRGIERTSELESSVSGRMDTHPEQQSDGASTDRASSE